MSWEDLLKREPISYRDREDLMDVQPRLDKGASGHIQSLGEGHWWNKPDSDKSIEHYLDYYGSATYVRTDRQQQSKIQVKAENKTLTEDEWRQYVRDVNHIKNMESVDDHASLAGDF